MTFHEAGTELIFRREWPERELGFASQAPRRSRRPADDLASREREEANEQGTL